MELPPAGAAPRGGGPRICIGSGLAMMEAPLGLATLTQRYAFEPVSSAPVVPWASITLHPEGGMPLRLRRRPTGG